MRAYQKALQQQTAAAIKAQPTPPVQYVAVEDQIRHLMATLPPAQRQRPFSMVELTAQLRGRFRDRPHPMKIGAALRSMNWRSMRDWSASGRGARVWIPPGVQS